MDSSEVRVLGSYQENDKSCLCHANDPRAEIWYVELRDSDGCWWSEGGRFFFSRQKAEAHREAVIRGTETFSKGTKQAAE